MVAEPTATPVTIPVDPTVATPVALLLHVPPDVESERVMVAPLHTVELPEIADGIVGPVVTVIVFTA